MSAISEKAVSKQQQRLMGIVHALQKGDMKPSKASGKAKEMAKSMKKSDVKDFASTKHKGLPKKVKKENMGVASMYAVLEATPDMKETDLVVEFNPLEGVQHINVDMNRVVDVFTGADEARAIAAEVYKKCMDEAFQLEEKKGKVGDKLKKTIDHLEKKRKEHVDMAKEDPKNASQHKEHIAKLASQIDDLMSKMEKIEKSKKNVEKKEDLKESNLSAGGNLKVGDKIVNTKRPQTLTVTKIEGDNISIESDILPGKTFTWPKDAVDQGIKSGELRWQPIDEVENSEDASLTPGERYDIRSERDFLNFLKNLYAKSPTDYIAQKIKDQEAKMAGKNK